MHIESMIIQHLQSCLFPLKRFWNWNSAPPWSSVECVHFDTAQYASPSTIFSPTSYFTLTRRSPLRTNNSILGDALIITRILHATSMSNFLGQSDSKYCVFFFVNFHLSSISIESQFTKPNFIIVRGARCTKAHLRSWGQETGWKTALPATTISDSISWDTSFCPFTCLAYNLIPFQCHWGNKELLFLFEIRDLGIFDTATTYSTLTAR